MSAPESPVFVLRPDAFRTDPSGDARVWSPVEKRYLKMKSSAVWLLQQFQTPRTVESVVARSMVEAPDGPDRRRVEEAVRSAVDHMRSCGILVEQLRATTEELGDWLVSDISPDELEHYGGRTGRWHTVEIGSEALGEAIARRSEGKERSPALASPMASGGGFSGDCAREGEPLLACRRPDGRILVLGAAERAREAWISGGPVVALLLSPEDWLARAVEAPGDFFGTQRGGIPYQSIVHEGHVLVEGRRLGLDMIDRMSRLRREDLAGKRVLDLGCNIGMNCQLAHAQGVRETVGFDSSAELIGAALSINCYFGTPSRFYVHDLETRYEGRVVADTALCFALLGHLRRIEGLKATLRAASVRVLYLETHCAVQSQGEIDALLASGITRRTEFLGFTRDNVVRKESTRRLYRCELA